MSPIKFYIRYIISSIKWFFYNLKNKNDGNYTKLKYNGYGFSKIKNWVARERYEPCHTSIHDPKLKEAKKIHHWVLRNIKYIGDEKNYNDIDHWATTKEILERGSGDCEDQAFVIYKKLMAAGYPEKDIGIILIEGHAFACIYYCPYDFYVLDNGYMTMNIVKASKLFPYKKLEPIAGFNLTDCWSY